jgi:hypothetical protein
MKSTNWSKRDLVAFTLKVFPAVLENSLAYLREQSSEDWSPNREQLEKCLVSILLLNRREVDRKLAKRFKGAKLVDLVRICRNALDDRDAPTAALYGFLIGAFAGTVRDWVEAGYSKRGKSQLNALERTRRLARSAARLRGEQIRDRVIALRCQDSARTLTSVRQAVAREFGVSLRTVLRHTRKLNSKVPQ